MDIFSDWIRSLENSGVKLYEIADIIDVTYQTIQCYRDRNNYPTAKNLIRLSEHYNISIDDMLYYNEDSPPAGTPDERTLLRLFRKLPPNEQELIIERMTELAEGAEGEQENSSM